MTIKKSQTPWNKLNMSRQQYFEAPPWKKAKMKRKQFEEILLFMPDDFLDDCKREGEADLLVKAMFGGEAV